MWVEDGSLVELHLGEVALEQGFQLKIRGNTGRRREKAFSLRRTRRLSGTDAQRRARHSVSYSLMEKNNFYIDIVPVLV